MANPVFQFDTDEEAIRVLKAEARKLKYCAVTVWRKYLSSYRPKVYVRTRKSQSSIKVGNIKKLDDNTYCIEVTFDDGLVYHDSVINPSQSKGHAVMLISAGWKVKRGKHRDVYRFGYYEGFNYLQKVEQMYNTMKDKIISFEIEWSGAKTK